MRIADVVASWEVRPDVVVATDDELGAQVAGLLDLQVVARRPGEATTAVVLVVADTDDVAGAVTGAGADLAPDDHVLVLLDVAAHDVTVGPVVDAVVAAGLALVEVVAVAHPTLVTALHATVTDDPATAAPRSALVLEQAAARGARAAVAATARELDRRGERIDALVAEVTELRERLETVATTHERAVASRDKELVVLRRDVRDLERSTSYRIGHALVRLLRDPTLLRKVPGRILRRLRS